MHKIDKNFKYIIGVSGGPDSIYLLNQMIKIKPKDLIVAHVNYNFRKCSSIDQNVVEQFCKNNNLKFEIKIIEPSTYKTLKINFEAWCRKIRYDFFCELNQKNNFDGVLIAHNQNDLVETYLLQKQRHNLVNYYGLEWKTIYKDMKVYRPLLEIKKSFILKELNTQNINYVLDKTNNDLKYLRNRIRNQLTDEDIDDYQKEINLKNFDLTIQKSKVNHYFKIFVIDSALIISKPLFSLDENNFQRLIVLFFKKQGFDWLLYNRSNSLIGEVCRRLKNSKKSFWYIELEEWVLIKDYGLFYLWPKNNFEFKTFKIDNIQDLKKIKQNIFINFKEIQDLVKTGNDFPYVITNDFPVYKTHTFYKKKRTNHYLTNEKIPYWWRYSHAIIYSLSQEKILNIIKNVNMIKSLRFKRGE